MKTSDHTVSSLKWKITRFAGASNVIPFLTPRKAVHDASKEALARYACVQDYYDYSNLFKEADNIIRARSASDTRKSGYLTPSLLEGSCNDN
jgi:hypothetical protein